MSTITLETRISAHAEICFDLMRDIRIHTETTAETDERAIAGVTEGTIALGQTVTFEGRHLGMRRTLTVKVVEYDRPRLFVDEMIAGPFRSFRHTHEFSETDSETFMKDTIEWTTPFGNLGKLVDKLILAVHLKKLVSTRNRRLKHLAEQIYSGSRGRAATEI